MSITEITGLAIDDERLTPNLLAERCTAAIADLTAERDKAKTRKERGRLNSRIHAANTVLRWAKTRAGYAPSAAGPARR